MLVSLVGYLVTLVQLEDRTCIGSHVVQQTNCPMQLTVYEQGPFQRNPSSQCSHTKLVSFCELTLPPVTGQTEYTWH